MFIHVHQVIFIFFSGITFNLMYLQCCCKARYKTERGGGVQDSLFATASKHRLAYFHTCVLHGQSTSSYPIPISPCEPHLIIAVYLKPDTHTHWRIHNDSLKKTFVHFSAIFAIHSASITAACTRGAARASPRDAAPIDKNPRLRKGCIQRHPRHSCASTGAACSRPEQTAAQHTAKSRLHFNVHFLWVNRTCILSDVNTSISTSQAMMVTISSFIFIDGIPLRVLGF